jgi:homoserine kinase
VVRVPATSANLGPGFDTLGLALAMHDEVELTALDGAERSVVDVTGEGAGRVPRDERHLVLKAACATYEAAGVPRPPLRLTCRNTIPHSRDLAAGFDGHADNVAACLTGGMVISWGHEGSWHSVRLEPHAALAPVVFVSDRSSSTEATRGLLPDRVPHGDAAFTAARAALVVHAVTTDPSLLLTATEDRLHQPYRRPAYPATAALVDALRGAGIPATVSGAGPTVLALLTGQDLPAGLPTAGFRTLALPVDHDGASAELR